LRWTWAHPPIAQNCGSINVAATIDTSKAIPVAADGTFVATGVDFNAGGDGSRSFAASVDATGAGTKFVPATVTKNGDAVRLPLPPPILITV
jgi:hypothetical protein